MVVGYWYLGDAQLVQFSFVQINFWGIKVVLISCLVPYFHKMPVVFPKITFSALKFVRFSIRHECAYVDIWT